MFTLADNKENKTELRMAVVGALQDLMKTDPKVIALDADLGNASAFLKIKASNPDRFLDVGIAEANMAGVAAGLSVLGFKPFIHSFAPFASRRLFDQLFLSGAYAKTTINVYGSDPGFTAGPNGGTHTSYEDVGLMRLIPDSIVCDPADATQTAWLVREFAKLPGIHYFRANRKAVPRVYTDDSTFALGKANVLTHGADCLVIAAGQLVSDALKAAAALKAKGITVTVVDMFTIKPLDADLIAREVPKHKATVTFENHNVIGGLGSAVAEVIAEQGLATRFKRIGVTERFGSVGTQDWLQKDYHLTADDLAAAVEGLLH
jgi:transketolase